MTNLYSGNSYCKNLSQTQYCQFSIFTSVNMYDVFTAPTPCSKYSWKTLNFNKLFMLKLQSKNCKCKAFYTWTK